MNRTEYIARLRKALDGLPQSDIEDAVDYYNEYFFDAGKEHEQEVIDNLESPEQVAAQIAADVAVRNVNSREPKKSHKVSAIWAVILGIFALPVGLPLAITAVVLLATLVIVAAVVILSLFVSVLAIGLSGIACLVAGVVLLFTSFASGLYYVGIGLLGIGLSTLFCILVAGLARVTGRGMTNLANIIRLRMKRKSSAKEGA